MLKNVDWEMLREVLQEVTVPGTKWITSNFERFIDVGRIILKEIQKCTAKQASYVCFPSLITLLYLQSHIPPKI
ncbi:Ribonucleoside-diphosphate reductase large chain [Gossypium arboreum]|uniref:Ribonucleoside-diphosphate reductase large chain n=1 Tax=Gossypium arboreum TaxID=29729 RepID=A0A0B0MS62_GOSAR|nr:Ribonucleoside-diphosphate reductase large chain [Gossypium arboreum]